MKGYAFILLCAVALGKTEQVKVQRSSRGGTCPCSNDNVAAACTLDGNQGELFEHQNCNQFYKCSNGQAIPYFCPANLVYNHEERICDWIVNVDCGNRPIVEIEVCPESEEPQPEPEPEPHPEPQPESQPELDNGGTCNCNPEEAPGICATDGSDGTLVAHENCNQFYRCNHGAPVAVSCPSGLLYNPYIEVCDWPENVDCGDRPIVEAGESSEEKDDHEEVQPEPQPEVQPEPLPEPENGGTCNCNPGEAPAICAADGSDGTLVANENCNQFYKCVNGVPVIISCPAGLVYNPLIECCDWPANVDCGDKPIVEIGGGDNGNGENGSGDSGNGDSGSVDSGNGDSGSGDNGTNEGTCNCNPGEAPGICAIDGSDGTLVAHENCNQFYRCNHGAPVAVSCPSGLLYNPYIEVCDWPENVDCGDRPIVEAGESSEEKDDHEDVQPESQPEVQPEPLPEPENGGTCNCNPGEAPAICAADSSDGTLVANENCNQFYKCVNGVPVIISCPAGLVYNPLIECCDWSANVDCGDKPIVEIDGGDNGNGENGSGDNGSGDSGNGDSGTGDNGSNGGTCNCNPGLAPGICATDGSDGTLVAHENCNQFYRCNHGAPVAVSCPSGLLYNPYIEVCDWPENVDCGDRPIVEAGESSEEKDDHEDVQPEVQPEPLPELQPEIQPEPENGGTCNCNPGEAPAICAADDSDGTLVANENCNQFYKCVNGVPVIISCPTGLVYNPLIECCDWPANVDCGDKPIVEIGGGDNGNGENGSGDSGNGDSGSVDSGNGNSGSGDNGTNEGTCNCNPGEAPGICAIDGSDGTLVAHENCNQFYRCNHGAPVVVSCPSGLLYNPYIEVCDWPENVDCEDRPSVEVGESSEEKDDHEDVQPESQPEVQPEPQPEPENGGTCNCYPGEAPGICGADGSDGTLVAHENCNQFYRCNHGAPVAVSCPSGLLYNPYIEVCDWPENVDCRDRPIVEAGESSEEKDDQEDVQPESQPEVQPEPENGGTCNCNPGEAPAICAADGSDGTLVANENCNQFYKCVNGVPVIISCPAGLVYNPLIECCDWPANVDCGDKPIVEIGGGDNDNGENGSGDNGSVDSGNGDSSIGDNGSNGGTCNCNPEEAPGICATDGSDGTLVAHENCNQFYRCNHGAPVAVSCPSDLLYNPYIEVCDWPENVDCGDRPIVEAGESSDEKDDHEDVQPEPQPEAEPEPQPEPQPEPENGGTCNCNPGEAPAICATGDAEGVLIAHENCNKFYKCSFGNPVTFRCPGDLLYNPLTEQCDWATNVECGERVITEEDSSIVDKLESQELDNQEGGQTGGNEDPSEALAICAAKDSDGILVAHENCNQFTVCSSGVPVVLSCPGNLLYNPSIEQCDWPANVDCGNRLIPEPEVPEGDSSVCLCNPKQATNVCSGADANGKMIAHESCSKYYICFNGLPIVQTCPIGLFYEPVTQQCTTAVSCDGRLYDVFSFNKHVEARRGLFN